MLMPFACRLAGQEGLKLQGSLKPPERNGKGQGGKGAKSGGGGGGKGGGKGGGDMNRKQRREADRLVSDASAGEVVQPSKSLPSGKKQQKVKKHLTAAEKLQKFKNACNRK